MKRYNIPRYKSFTDEAIQLTSMLENVSITAIVKIVSIKRQDFPANSAEKFGRWEKKLGPIVILTFLVSLAPQKKIYLSLCVWKKFNITRIDPTFREKKISNYQQIKYL